MPEDITDPDAIEPPDGLAPLRALEKRRALMSDWAAYLTSRPADVLPIRRVV